MHDTTTCHGCACPKREGCARYIGNRPAGSRSQIGDCQPYDQPLTGEYPLFDPLLPPTPHGAGDASQNPAATANGDASLSPARAVAQTG